VEGVRARVAAVVHADRASLDPGAQRVTVGTVLDEAPGLKVGEKVIVDGIQKVRPGQVVQETVVPEMADAK